MAGLLRKLKQVTRDLGGNCVLVADPSQRCLMVMRPVIKKWPVPEEVAVRFWGVDDEPAETEYESTVPSEASDLTRLSRTPSGFTDWKLEAEDSGKKRPATDNGRRTVKRPKMNPHGLVTAWLDRKKDLVDVSGSEDDDGVKEDPTPVMPQESISRQGTCFDEADAVFGVGYDGTMDAEVDLREEEAKEGDDDDNDDDDDDDGEDSNESGSVWADGEVSDGRMYQSGSDAVTNSSPMSAD